ncbi:MAG: endolytic transglycosylase MltG [Acidobacteriales bacterium]|nr:endolytic transglycosylase MltG [Terriglobales bacterium]
MRAILTFLLLVIVAVAGWLAWALWLPLQPSAEKIVLFYPGYSTRRIAGELKSAGVIRDSHAFLLWHYLHREASLKAGEYKFDHPASAIEVHRCLARGDVYFHTVVIPEGFTIFDVANAIQESGLSSREDFLKVATSRTDLVSDLSPSAKSLEGFLFPETYNFTRTQSLDNMVAEMVKQFRTVAHEIGLSEDVPRIVTMASIVEKESAVPEERPLVASVYYRRLQQNVALDADPTVIYAELLSGTYTGALHHQDMQVNSPYNTYRYPGLPPGPIGNPGKSALQAAMHPAQSDYLYFVGDGSGHHRFSSTLEEHNRNVALYRKAMQNK